MSAFSLKAGGVAALLSRLLEQPFDATHLAVLQERLQRHGAQLQGQLPDLLLRGPNPEISMLLLFPTRSAPFTCGSAEIDCASMGFRTAT